MTVVPDAEEATFQLTRGLALAATVLLALALERWRPHERLRPAWATNVGLWAVDTLVVEDRQYRLDSPTKGRERWLCRLSPRRVPIER